MGYERDLHTHIRRQVQPRCGFAGTQRASLPRPDTPCHPSRRHHQRIGEGWRPARGIRRAVRPEFAISPNADKWAKRITNPPSRLDKLGIKPAMTVVLLGVKDAEFVARSEDAPTRSAAGSRPVGGTVDVIFYRADDRAALEELPALSKLIKQDGAVWILGPRAARRSPKATRCQPASAPAWLTSRSVVLLRRSSAQKFVIPVAKRTRA